MFAEILQGIGALAITLVAGLLCCFKSTSPAVVRRRDAAVRGLVNAVISRAAGPPPAQLVTMTMEQANGSNNNAPVPFFQRRPTQALRRSPSAPATRTPTPSPAPHIGMMETATPPPPEGLFQFSSQAC